MAVDLEAEPISLSVVTDARTGRVSFSDVPQRVLPALIESYGKQAVANAIGATPGELELINTLELSGVRPARYLSARPDLATRVAQVEAEGLAHAAVPYFMAAINLSDEAVLGKSGALYFVCGKGCHFCQYRHFDEAQLTPEGIAERMLALQAAGADNIQWVSPSAYTGVLVKALALAAARGLTLPVVHKGEGEDSLEDLRRLDGLVDMYLPDIKFIRPEAAERIGLSPEYPERMMACIREMYRQVGPLKRQRKGSLLQGGGLMVRHLLMPNGVEEAERVLDFILALDPALPVHIMTGYEPLHGAKDRPGIDRPVTDEEIAQVAEAAHQRELTRVLVR